MKPVFSFDAEKCSACGACAVACMDQNDIDIVGGQEPYRRVFRRETDGRVEYGSVACLHCGDAPCVLVCPGRCIRRDEDTGLVLVESERCIGCRACYRVCPVGAPTFRPTGLERPAVHMEKCDGCYVRVECGLEPACVRVCPTGALTWERQ